MADERVTAASKCILFLIEEEEDVFELTNKNARKQTTLYRRRLVVFEFPTCKGNGEPTSVLNIFVVY
jgi:hypothetical protein